MRTPLQVIRDAAAAPKLRDELAEALEERDEAIIAASMCDVPGLDEELPDLPYGAADLADIDFPDDDDLKRAIASRTFEVTDPPPLPFVPGLIENRVFITVTSTALVDPQLAQLETEIAEAAQLIADGKASPCPGGPLDVDGICDELKEKHARTESQS